MQPVRSGGGIVYDAAPVALIQSQPSRLPASAEARSLLVRPVLGLSPLEQPDARLILSLCRAGALGVLDLALSRARRAKMSVAVAVCPSIRWMSVF